MGEVNGEVGGEVSLVDLESSLARDMARHAVLAAPVVLLVAAIWRGWDGMWSAAFALVLVVVNFLATARSYEWAARISPAALAGVALGGYVARLAVITVAVLVVKDAGWVDLVTLGITLVGAHLGLLFWELRSVSLSLAAPGLKPGKESARW